MMFGVVFTIIMEFCGAYNMTDCPVLVGDCIFQEKKELVYAKFLEVDEVVTVVNCMKSYKEDLPE